jgi:hypothetical protein
LYPTAQVFSIGTGGYTLANLPQALASATFQVQQVLLENQSDALARRLDMTSHALSYPVRFRQQEVAISLNQGGSITPDGSTLIQTVLTGFRSGEVVKVHTWLTADSVNTPTQSASGSIYSPFSWYGLENVTMTYAGDVYHRGDKNSTQLWNLVNGKIPSQVNDIQVTSGSAPGITTAFADAWSILPFGQSYSDETAHSMYVAGKNITNGIVNLSFSIPASAPASTYTLHVVYEYNAVLTFSQGTCDYVF